MNSGLHDYSCLNVLDGIKRDTVLNHALNLHTVLSWIKDDSGIKEARALFTISSTGKIDVYPVHLTNPSLDRKELSTIMFKFSKLYAQHLGIYREEEHGNGHLIHSFPNIPASYDQAIEPVDLLFL